MAGGVGGVGGGTGSDLRRKVRKRTFLQGRIVFNNGCSTMDCLIRDMSESGARLELSETSTLPNTFDLYIPNRDTTLRATLCWRRGEEVGITFLAQPAAPVPDATAALHRRIAELEAENAGLRALLFKPQQTGAA